MTNIKQKYVELFTNIVTNLTKSNDYILSNIKTSNIIACFAKSEFINKNNEDQNNLETQLIASIQYMECCVLDLLKTVKNVSNEKYNFLFNRDKLCLLLVVPFLHDVEYQEFNDGDSKVVIRFCTMNYLINNINLIYEFEFKDSKAKIQNPIVIFSNISWSNIIYLLKLSGVSVSGGSITRRHKLSIVEYNLSTFFHLLSEVFEADNLEVKELLYKGYIDKCYTNPKIDKDFYLHQKGLKATIVHSNPVIIDYLIINYYIKLYLVYKPVFDKYLTAVEELTLLENNLRFNISKFDSLSSQKNYKQRSLDKLVGDNSRSKSKASLSGQIHNIVAEIKLNKSDKLSLTDKINNLKSSIIKLERELENYKIEFDKTKNIYLNNSVEGESKETKNINKVDIQKISKDIKFTSKSLNKNLTINNIIKRDFHVGRVNYLAENLQEVKTKSTDSKIITNSKDYSIDSPLFKELKRKLLESPLNENTQLDIESFLHNQASFLFKDKLNQKGDLNYNILSSEVQNILKSSIVNLCKLLQNLEENIKLNLQVVNKKSSESSIKQLKLLYELLSVDFLEIISLMLGRLLRIISNKNLVNNNTIFTNVAIDLGSELVNKYFYLLYKNSNEYGLEDFRFSTWLELHKEKAGEFNDQLNLSFFGANLINLLCEMNLLEQSMTKLDSLTKVIYLIPGKTLFDKIGEFKILELPNKIPMIVRPKNYGRYNLKGKIVEQLGGYLLNDLEFANEIIIRNWELKYQSKIKDINVIYNLVNNISSVGFKINKEVLDFVFEFGKEFNLHTDFDFVHPLSNKTSKLTSKENKELESYISQQKLDLNIIGLASIFKDVPEFFIPVRLDNRGRVYCNCDYLNYQSTDLAKSLLLFSKEEKIDLSDKVAINYLKIFGANCFGNGIEKKSFWDRVNWVSENEDNIINFNNGILVKKAESKPLFVSFCFEYLKYYKAIKENKSYFYSGFPIQLDATCNGYQHLALLIGDHSLAEELNLKESSWFDKPKDFYTFLALSLKEYFEEKVKNILNKKDQTDTDNLESYQRLANLNIQRALLKKPVMTKPYNVTHYQMVKYIKEDFNFVVEDNNNSTEHWFEYTKDPSIKLKGTDINLLSKAIEFVIYKKFPKLYDFSIYLKRIAQICVGLNITIPWCLPTGLDIEQFYMDTDSIRLKPFVFNRSTFKLNLPNKNKINRLKQVRALMPNLVHSLDASSLAILVDLFFKDDSIKIKNFYAVHDCFAVTPNNVEELMNKLRLVYTTIYTNNSYLKIFDSGIRNHIKLHFGITNLDESNKFTVNNQTFELPDINQVINGIRNYTHKDLLNNENLNNLDLIKINENKSIIAKNNTPYLAS